MLSVIVALPASADRKWELVKSPTNAAPAQSIGGYSAGCVAGAKKLPRRGPGYLATSARKRRNFGHPTLVAYVESLATKFRSAKLGILRIGDLGQARGGPAPSGHASHQSGLDVDIKFLEPRHGHGGRILDKRGRLRSSVAKRAETLLRLAASDDRVARIFVNPAIKRALCVRSNKAPWLHKLRPWFGHRRHMHVRLHCPASSPECEPQKAFAKGHGCDELDWWFDKKAQADRRKSQRKYGERVATKPPLPPACQAILAE